MYRRAIRSLFVAAALLLTTTACDKGGDAGAESGKSADAGKQADDGKADEAGAEAGVDTTAAAAAATATAGVPGEAADSGEAGGTGDGGDEGETGEPAAAETGEAGAKDDGAKDDADEAKPEKSDKPEPKAAPPKDDDKTASAPKLDGKPLYEKKCKSCHGIDGKGDTTIGKKVDIPSLVKTKLSKAKVVSLIEKGVPDTKMKAFKDKLSKDEIDAVATYVKTL